MEFSEDSDKEEDRSGPAVDLAGDSREGSALDADNLRAQICAAITARDVFPAQQTDGCTESGQFEVIQRTVSTLYGHLDTGPTRPITFAMQVLVTLDDDVIYVEPRRALTEDYRLEWTIDLPNLPSTEEERFVARLSQGVGEYFRYEGTEWAQLIRAIEIQAVPADIVEQARATVAQFNAQDPSPNATLEMGAYAIVQSATTIGYVLQVEFHIDEPEFDGGGIRHYFTAAGRHVVSVGWSG